MTRTTFKTLLATLVAVLMLGSVGEAATKKPVRHRPKHSSRVSSASTPIPTKKKTATRKKKNSGAKTTSKTTVKTKKQPATKPR